MIHMVVDSSTLRDCVEKRRPERFWSVVYSKLARESWSAERARVVAVREEVGDDLLASFVERFSEQLGGILMLFFLEPTSVSYVDVRSKILRMYGKIALTTIRRFFDLDPEDLEDSRGELDSDAFLLVTALYSASSCGRTLVLTSDEKARSLLNSALDRLREHPSLGSVFERVFEP